MKSRRFFYGVNKIHTIYEKDASIYVLPPLQGNKTVYNQMKSSYTHQLSHKPQYCSYKMRNILTDIGNFKLVLIWSACYLIDGIEICLYQNHYGYNQIPRRLPWCFEAFVLSRTGSEIISSLCILIKLFNSQVK